MAEPIITLRVKGTNTFASSSYNPEADQLEAISIWDGAAWAIIQEAKLRAPVTFVSVPTIEGQPNVEFVCDDLKSDRAKRAV